MISTDNPPNSVQARPEMVVISDGLAMVEIAPETGGAIASYRWQIDGSKVDWLRPASAQAIESKDAGNMSCFPLVPYSNRIRNSRFTFDGQAVTLPGTPADPHFEHGHGWRNAWKIVRQHAASIILLYRHTADTWPWDYEAEQSISLENGILTITISVRNLSQTAMPVGFGLHPYFPSTPQTRLTTVVDGMWETDSEVLPTNLVAIPPEADPNEGLHVTRTELDTVFTGWSRNAHIEWPEEARSLKIEAESPLNYLTIYTPANEPFFCAEPVSNITNAFNLDDRGIETGQIKLQPGESRSASVRFVPSLD